MNCYREDCQRETHHCCQECGQPVCKKHRTTICTPSVFLFPGPFGTPPLPFDVTNAKTICDSCVRKLQESGQEFYEVAGI